MVRFLNESGRNDPGEMHGEKTSLMTECLGRVVKSVQPFTDFNYSLPKAVTAMVLV